jgi:hypothetical protein
MPAENLCLVRDYYMYKTIVLFSTDVEVFFYRRYKFAEVVSDVSRRARDWRLY